ncbi:DUF4157 domain-containing protein [Nocardia abscessus]|uniref:eCIS core domain-containing protein n=1 Tax=Nocardia abscessus TaxID=120957 RepID=UPI001E28DF5A|nr:DUF4157 domain-containing protein [Nocardia abscessus]
MTTPSDPLEIEAASTAAAGHGSPRGHGSEGGHRALRPEDDSAVRAVLSEPGAALPARLRHDAQARLGSDFSGVRVHTGPRAESSARAVDAAAYTVGPHIVFGAGRFAPETRAGRQVLTHELTHVAQQAHSGRVVLARQPANQDDPDKNVSLGALDSALVTRVGEAVVGPASWTIAREFLRGLRGGLASVSPDQQARIDKKFDDCGPLNAAKYAGGYLVGIVIGLGQGLWGLVEALWTLITLPYKVAAFTYQTLPELAAKYVPRIQQIVDEGGGLKGIVADLLKNPRETWQALSGIADLVKAAALAKVRPFGRGAAKDILALLEEDWYSFGRDIGKVVGRVLFEIALLVASDAIGNIVKGAAEIAGKIAARAVEGVVDMVRAVGRLLGKALDWLATIGKIMSGKAAEIFEKFKVLLGKLRTVMAEMLPEVAETNIGGFKMAVPETKGAAVLESRAVRDPHKVAQLTPPKVHPSKAGAPTTTSPRAPETPSRITDKEISEHPGGGTQGGEPPNLQEVLDEAIDQLDKSDQPFRPHGKSGLQRKPVTKDIDEIRPVGEKGISPQEARARALDVYNHQFLDPATNRSTKYLGAETRPGATGGSLVSVAENPNALVTRTFGEIVEMRAIFDEAVGKIKNPGGLSPTALKARINDNIWDIIKTGNSEAAVRVREALGRLGFVVLRDSARRLVVRAVRRTHSL